MYLEPIKTALVEGNHAKARALRAALFKELLDEALGVMVDPMNFIDGPPTGFIHRVENVVNQVDALGIQEES